MPPGWISLTSRSSSRAQRRWVRSSASVVPQCFGSSRASRSGVTCLSQAVHHKKTVRDRHRMALPPSLFPRNAESIWRRSLYPVDHHHIDKRPGGLKLQPELLLECREDIGRRIEIGGIGRREPAEVGQLDRVRRESQLEVIPSGETGLIDDGLVQDVALQAV